MKATITALLLLCHLANVARSDEATATPTATSAVLAQRAEAGDTEAILELGNRGDTEVTPLLQALISNRTSAAVPKCARMALAKLGNKPAFAQIVNQLQANDPAVKSAGIEELTYIGGNGAIRALAGLLYDPTSWSSEQGFKPEARGPRGERPIGREVYEPPSYEAMRALAKIVADPPQPAPSATDEERLQVWRSWWEAHRNQYEAGVNP
jgi:hypothetical protein